MSAILVTRFDGRRAVIYFPPDARPKSEWRLRFRVTETTAHEDLQQWMERRFPPASWGIVDVEICDFDLEFAVQVDGGEWFSPERKRLGRPRARFAVTAKQKVIVNPAALHEAMDFTFLRYDASQHCSVSFSARMNRLEMSAGQTIEREFISDNRHPGAILEAAGLFRLEEEHFTITNLEPTTGNFADDEVATRRLTVEPLPPQGAAIMG